MSRHYYDLHLLLPSDAGARALADPALLLECVRHASMFFGRPDFDLESASAGRFGLAPRDAMRSGLRRDYDAMAGMVFGPIPVFDDVLVSIAALEASLLEKFQK